MKMEQMEKSDRQKKKRVGAILVAIGIILYMMLYSVFFFWILNHTDISKKILWCFIAIPIIVIVVVIIALIQRLKEIKGGEEDEATKY